MTRTIASLLVLLALAGGAAHALGVGHLGLGMGKLGAAGSQGSNGSPVGCTMNGTLDLTNTCNIIYFVGGLK